MNQVEVIPDSGLVIVRQGIDPALAKDFQDEWFAHLKTWQHDQLFGQLYRDRDFFSDSVWIDAAMEDPKLPVTQRVVEKLQLAGENEAVMHLTVNYQPAKVAQGFHADRKSLNDRGIVIHGGDNGAFDFATGAKTKEEAEKSYRTLELSAGDIVFLSRPYSFHRGRNTGETPRVTGVFSLLVEDYFFGLDR